MRELLVFSTENCVPCKQLYSYCQSNNKSWEFVYPSAYADLYKELNVKTAPTLVEKKNGNYSVLAVGLNEIYKMLGAGLLEDTWEVELRDKKVNEDE